MALKKKPREDSEYSWMDTYGDLVTLVLTFFILLFSFSSIDNKKFQMLRAAFSNAGPAVVINALDATEILGLGGKFSVPTYDKKFIPKPLPQKSPIPDDYVPSEDQQGDEKGGGGGAAESEFNKLYKQIQKYIGDRNLGDALVAIREGDVITIQVTARLLFPSGSADLLPDAQGILSDVGGMLENSITGIRLIRVEGHTDNIPISNSRFQDNWDLSAKRATNTVRYLNKNSGIPMDLFSAMGYGEFSPIESNDTEAGRAKNRRVTFVIEKKAEN